MARLNNIKNGIIDCIYPRLSGENDKIPKLTKLDHNLSESLAIEAKNMLVLRIAEMEERNESVDRKLLSLFRTTSLLATVSTVVFLGVARLQSVDESVWTPIVYGIMISILYAFLQLCLAVKATIEGLRAKSYLRLNRDSLIPSASETLESYNNRLVENMIYAVEKNEWTINSKVDFMELAYVGLRNALIWIGDINDHGFDVGC